MNKHARYLGISNGNLPLILYKELEEKISKRLMADLSVSLYHGMYEILYTGPYWGLRASVWSQDSYDED